MHVFVFLLFILGVKAETVSVYEMVKGKAFTMLKLDDGRVAYLPLFKSQDDLTGKKLSVTFKKGNEISKYSVVGERRVLSLDYEKPLRGYEPTVLLDYAEARKVMGSFNRKWLETAQCYDRAHVWVYDEYKKYNTKLMKAFLFFSDSYIERYKFEWWFHAAPVTYVRMNGESTPRVLDPRFAKDPLQFKKWTDIFMKNDAECRTISNYTEYSEHPGEDDCFLLETTMHYWQPKELEQNLAKNKFVDWEVTWAFKEGFGITLPFNYGDDDHLVFNSR